MYINNVTAGIAKSVEDLASGRSLRVVGDGKVEPAIADRFQSSGFIDNIDDRRLRNFMNLHAEIREARLTKAESEVQIGQAIASTLGEEWAIKDFYTYSGEQGVARLDLRLNEPGRGDQVLYLENREREPKFSVTTTSYESGWKVIHQIESPQASRENYTESGRLEKA